MNVRDESLDAVKGFAILLVLIGHCLVWNNLSNMDPYVYDFIKSVQMPLFMMISGYLAGIRIAKRNFADTVWLIAKRAVSYLVPFFVWPMLLHPMHPVREMKGILFQLDKGMWFLMTLFIVSAVTLIAQYVADLIRAGYTNEVIRFVLFACVIAGFYVLFFIQGRLGVEFLSPSLTVMYLPYYVIGYSLTAYVKRLGLWKCSIRKQNVSVAILAIIFLSLVLGTDLQKMNGMPDLILQMTAGLLGSAVCFYCIYHLKDIKFKKVLSRLGTVTLELYIFQYAMHAFFVKIRNLGDVQYNLYCFEGVLTVLVTFVIMCVISAAGIWIISKVKLLDMLLFGHIKLVKKKHHA